LKKNKKVAIVKESRKIAKKELEFQILDALKLIFEKFPSNQKKLEKLLTKNAKQLVGKLSKEIIFKSADTETSKVVAAKEVKKSAVKAKVTVKKEETPA
jgi:dihydroxyacetone kinase-like predicted kinase